MRIWLLLLVGCLSAQAHIGSPNVFFDGTVGEYRVQVIIRPPQVVPGQAEITVRTQGGPVDHVSVLPVFWNVGRKGAPPPDEARLVSGQTNLYSAALWLMKSGAYSVDVNVQGPRGEGTLIVPVDSIATNTRPMSRLYGIVLSILGIILFLGGLKIAGAMAGESRLEPGASPTRRDRWRARGGVALAAVLLSAMVFGGKKWWDSEDRDYRNHSLYQRQPLSAQVQTEREQHLLKLTVETSEHRGRWTPLIPDHGKLMHLFLIRDAEPRAFAHLHPLMRKKSMFEAPLPPLPAGAYSIYADVTHENGFSETLTTTVNLPAPTLGMKQLWLGNSVEPICSFAQAQMLATNLAIPPDMDDSWQMDSAQRAGAAGQPRARAVDLTGGYKMTWEDAGSLTANQDASLRFRLFAPGGQPALMQPYMGMAGHAVIWRRDGAVFAHIHPVGTFSMAAQDFFLKGRFSNQSAPAAPGLGSAPENPSNGKDPHLSHTNEAGYLGEISFPYAFPQAGAYRVWVQARTEGRILTGVFDAAIQPEK